MARKMKKFSEGGAQGRYDRRMADIEKDFKKAMARKTGKDAEVAEAKRQQRIADAKDDLAKRTGADRTATRKAEYDAEKNLSRTRKFGADKPAAKTEPAKTIAPAAAPAAAPEAAKAKPSSFKEAFKEARSRLGAGKTFTFGGKSYTTNIAGEGRKDVQKPVQKPIQKSAPTPEKKAAPEKTVAPSKFDSKAFADLKAKMPKPITNTGGTLLRGKPGGASLISGTDSRAFIKYGDAVRNDPARAAKLAEMKRAAEAPGASKWRKDAYRDALSSGMYAKGGKVKKEKTMKYAKGGSTPPQPSAADRARSKKHLAELKKLKPSAEEGKVVASANRSEGPGYKKGGKMAPKFGAAMKKKSADTKGRAMMKFAKGGSIDGCATKGKTKGKMV